jgi:hypothetical protein
VSGRDAIPDDLALREKAYYGRRLLELGPLPYCEFREVTGWPAHECETVLRHMQKTQVAEHVNGQWRLRA